MLVVSVRGGNIEWAIKDYKKRVQSIKQIEELRERKNFIKPSKRKRLQKEETIRKNKLFFIIRLKTELINEYPSYKV
jgi:small subunit ribosomal protein S21